MYKNQNSYSADDVAKYIIKYANDINKPITNLKLQKILYYVQAQFLVYEKKECFSDDIEAWDFGPVIPSIFNKYIFYGMNSIRISKGGINKKSMLYSTTKGIPINEVISDYDKIIINYISNHLLDIPNNKLVEYTQTENPWKYSYKRYCRNIIHKNSIIEFFSK